MARTVKSFLIFLLAGFWCFQLSGATNGFETPPPQHGSIQWQILQNTAKQRQELYRKRVTISGAITGNVSVANDALFAKHPEVAAASPAVSSRTLLKLFLSVAALIFCGGLILWGFAPHILADFNQRFNPWVPAPITEWGPPARVRAEEESFAQFLAMFRVGPSAACADSSEKEDLIKEFYARAPKRIAVQRKLLQDIGREPNGAVRQKMLTDLYLEMGGLKNEADFPAALPVWQVSFALEGLVKQFMRKMRSITPSTLRTVTGGLDLLENLCRPGLQPLANRPFTFLVVDDDVIGRQALSLALNKAFSHPDIAVDGETALAMVNEKAYDVIFLDVQMPGMDGFEVCTKIHETALNRATPIVFVTILSDFDARAQSAISGGSDLLGKPFLIFEITVKALTLALQARLQPLVQKPASESDESLSAPDSSEIFSNRARVKNFEIEIRPTMAATLETDGLAAAFLNRASKNIGPLKELCQTILQTSDKEARQNLLVEGFLRINSLISANDAEVVHPAYLMSITLEGLFRKLLEDPKHSTPSTLNTVATAVDLLNDLCAPGLKADLATTPPVQMLVVDDDLVARRAIVGALQTAFSKPESVESGEAALVLIEEKSFDVIFLDVKMPGMDGFETCSKIRDTALNCNTPVVFVTALSDFETRAQISSSGADLMGKPFLTVEIILKALTLVLRGRLQKLKTYSPDF